MHPRKIVSSTVTIENLGKRHLQWIMVLRAILYTFLLAINFFLSDVVTLQIITLPTGLTAPLLVVIYSITIASSYYLKSCVDNIKRFALIQILLDTFFATLFIYLTGCSHSIFTSVLFFPIITGGLILSGPQGLLAAATTTILYASSLILEFLGILPQYLNFYPIVHEKSLFLSMEHFSTRGITFFLVGLFSMLFALRLSKTESALSHSRKDFKNLSDLYKQIFNNISTGIITIDPYLNITSANRSSQNILGLPSSQLLQNNLIKVLPKINLGEANQRKTFSYDHPSGKHLRIGYSQMVLPRSAQEKSNTGNDHKIITLQDITEIEQLEAQVRQAEKLAAIGTMSASIAHDFRNPLAAISGSAQVLASEFSNSKNVEEGNYELCTIILRESNRLIETISEFLKFARPETSHCQWFSLRHCLKEVLEVCKATRDWPVSCTVDIHIEKNFDIWADQDQLFIVLNQLIQNALPFCPQGEEHLAITAMETTDEEQSPVVKIIFKDNGTGVPRESINTIFDPFYTTRPDGTGLGLAIVRQNITEHKGSITLTTVAPEGAEFVVILPLPA